MTFVIMSWWIRPRGDLIDKDQCFVAGVVFFCKRCGLICVM